MALNLIGQKFGMLTVVGRGESTKGGKRTWICVCDCGKTKAKPTTGCDLKSGKVRSCGCSKGTKGIHQTHGMTDSRLYHIWSGMKRRCKINQRYINRGITVCDEWIYSFEKFADWAMKNGYSDDLTLDRFDNNRGYFPENCRWVNMKVQENNRSNNRHITYGGKRYTISELADKLSIASATILWRINHGWSNDELALTPNYKNKHIRRNI